MISYFFSVCARGEGDSLSLPGGGGGEGPRRIERVRLLVFVCCFVLVWRFCWLVLGVVRFEFLLERFWSEVEELEGRLFVCALERKQARLKPKPYIHTAQSEMARMNKPGNKHPLRQRWHCIGTAV